MKWTVLLCAILTGVATSAGELDAKLSFSSDGGKTYYDDPPDLKVGSRLLVKVKWQPVHRDTETLTAELFGLQSDFASANRGKRDMDGRSAWGQRLPQYWFGPKTAGTCVHELNFTARPAGQTGDHNLWDNTAKKYVDSPLPACPALAPGNYMFQLRLTYWLKANNEQVTNDFPFAVKIVSGAPVKPAVAAKPPVPSEEWLPPLSGDYVFPASKCQGLYGAPTPKLDGRLMAGGSDCGWRVESVKEGKYYVRLLVESGGDGENQLGNSSSPFLFLNGVPVSCDHASEIGNFQKTCFAVVESQKPLLVKNGDTLRLNAARRVRFGGAALSTAPLGFAPVMVNPIALDWLHDRFTADAKLTPAGHLAVTVANRSGAGESYKVSCEVLDYFQNKVASFAASPSLADGEAFKRELDAKLSGTDRCRAVVTAEDGKGFKTALTVEALRDDLDSFRKKLWLNQGWRKVAGPGPSAPGAKEPVVELPVLLREGARPVLTEDEDVAWLKKTFTVPAAMAGGRLFVHFTRASQTCRVFLNGSLLGEHNVPDTAFDVELTGHYDPKGENILLLEVKRGSASSGMGNRTGGLGEAWLFSAPERMIGDVFPQTSFRNKRLSVAVDIPANSFLPGSTLSAKVSMAGRGLLSLPPVKLDSPGVKTLSARWDNPPLWGPDTFPLLRLTTELKGPDGALLDQVETRFGFREFWAEGMDLKWNGVKVNFASRAFLSCWGWMMQPGVRDKARGLMQLAKRNGCDMYRHVYDPEYFADIADEEGMPFAQGGSNTISGATKQQLDSDEFWGKASAVGAGIATSLRNHPSIVEWYLSNEYLGFSEKRNGERLKAYGEKVAAVDGTRVREFGCDLDLHGASSVVSTHYPVDGSALRTGDAYMPETFYWRRFGTNFTPGMKVPAGMFKGVANVFERAPITWGSKPIIINECCWITFFAPPDGFTRLVGDEVYRSNVATDAAFRLTMKWASRGHRDAQSSAITLWSWVTGDPNSYALPVVDVNLLQQWNKFRSGAKVAYDVNLTRDRRDARTLDFHWELRDASGQVLDRQTKTLNFSPCELKRERIVLKLPEVGEESALSLVAELREGGETCALQTLPLRVYPATTGGLLGLFGSDASKIQAKVKVGLFDPAGASAAKLRAVFDEAEMVGTPDFGGAGFVVVGENQKPEDLECAGEQLKAYVRGGGTVLLLRQNAPPRCLPVELILSDLDASTNFSYRPGHPLLDGVTADELNYWYPNHKTGSQYYVKPKDGNFKVVVESGGPRGMEYAGLVELPYGKGAFVCSQLDLLDNYADNPVAWKLMRNIAAFAAAPKRALGSVTFVGPAEPVLAKFGATLDVITSPEALQGRRAVILNAAEGVEPRFITTLKSFVADGGELLVLNADSNHADVLSELCGKRLTFRRGVPPSWAGRAEICRRGALAQGLNNYDLFWKDRPETQDVRTCFAQESMQAPVGTTTVEAEGVVPQLYPSFLLEVERGKGRVTFCNLNLEAKGRSVKNHASLLVSTLLTNLGGELKPTKDLTVPKDLAFFPVDISKVLNRSFVDEVAEDGKGGWSDQGPEADLRSFPMDKAVQTFNGVPFRIERPNSCLALSSKCARGGADRAELPVGMKVAALFFLQSSAWTSAAHHASYFVNYADGSSVEIRLVGGENLRDWAEPKPNEAFTNEEGTFSSCAWTGTMAKLGKCSLYVMAWPNPHPEKLVKAVTAVSMKRGVPILVALTAGVRSASAAKSASGSEALAKAEKLLAEADARFKAGKAAEAETLYQEAIATAWETRDAYLGLGYARERLGRRAAAIEAYEALVAINPKLFEPYRCIGRCYEVDGNLEKAVETYRRSLAMDPNQPDVMEALAKVKAKLEK